MDVMEKLVEILKQAPFEGKVLDEWWWEEKIKRIADHLIRNGVTVQELDGCKYCKEYEDLPEHFIDGEPVGRVFDTCIQPNENGLWHLEVPCGADIGIRFCPMCGRELPQPERRMIMAKNVVCKKCNNLVNDWCEKVIDSPDQDMQRECQYFCEKTNADRIRAMSDDELAEFLAQINPTNCQYCAFSHGWRCQPDRDDYSDFEKCEEGRKRWLKQPSE